MFNNAEDGKTGKLAEIHRDKILPRPEQPRKEFDQKALESLAQSIKENGILQPLLVRKAEKGFFELIAGERRFRASAIAGLSRVPCLIITASDKKVAVCSLLENIQRQELSIFEEAAAIASLISEYGMTQSEASQKLGMAQSTLANKLRLLRLTPEERAAILSLHLTERHARAVLSIEDPEKRIAILNEAGQKQLTVAKTEKLVEKALFDKASKQARRHLFVVKDVRIFLNTVSKAVQVMTDAGIPAHQHQLESDEFIEYVIRIPKSHAVRKDKAS